MTKLKHPKEYKLSFSETPAAVSIENPRKRSKPTEYKLAFAQSKPPSLTEIKPLSDQLSEIVVSERRNQHSISWCKFDSPLCPYQADPLHGLKRSDSMQSRKEPNTDHSVAKTAQESFSTIGTVEGIDALGGSSEGEIKVRYCQEEDIKFPAVPPRSSYVLPLSTVVSSDNDSGSKSNFSGSKSSCSAASARQLQKTQDDLALQFQHPEDATALEQSFDLEEEQHKTQPPKSQGQVSAMASVCFCIFLLMGIGGVGVAVFGSSQPTQEDDLPGNETEEILHGNMPFHVPHWTRQTILEDVNGTTPQCRAYEWVLEDPKWETYSKERLLQRFALATLYFSTNGDHWVHVGGDTVQIDYMSYNLTQDVKAQTQSYRRPQKPKVYSITSKQWLSHDTNECDWFSLAPLNGLTVCNEGNFIASLFLEKNGLSGTLPPELGLLTRLSDLDLFSGNLQGAIPTEIGLLTNLVNLNLAENNLQSTLPSEIGLLTNLESLAADRNRMEGTLPPEFYQLSNLQLFKLGPNHFAGSLPHNFGRLLPNTKLLWLQAHSLTGTIPHSLHHCKGLALLNLAENQLTGTIPSLLGSLPLGRIDLQNNRFSGSLPSELGLIPSLKTMELANNVNITGPLPVELGPLSRTLEKLSIAGTSITGTIPPDLCGINQLTFDCSASLCGCYCPCLNLAG
jgi:hypothetical protein